MIDWARVNVLRDEVGAEDFDEVVELFLEEVEEVTNRLTTAADPSTLEADMHFLKGSAMSLGFTAFAGLCQSGESMSAQGDAAGVDLAAVLACYDTSKRLFLAELPKAMAG